eukprot:TRINITY_DN16828_c0_g1_i2.p1 TRINITY_DN16828_c0_g1~~TRINITY_DN16828_c0_g1_i2.p1  ORF type:complete len:273 (-),score=53.06 TRINITY_DN16828_c0_g1_i2:396-1214(-)
MIKSRIEAGAGYRALDERILFFRAQSLMRMDGMASRFKDWRKERHPSDDGSKAHGMLLQWVRDMGAIFVALHCLYITAKDHEDDGYMQQLFREARECVYKEEAGTIRQIQIADEKMGLATAPPGFDLRKRCDDEETIQKILKDDNFLKEALTDLKKFPQPLGLLEMGVGGNLAVPLSEMIQKIQADEPGIDAPRQIFSEFDMDREGKNNVEAFTGVMAGLARDSLGEDDPETGFLRRELMSEDLKLLFFAADRNQDGFLDFDEFCELPKAGL